jgi:uncharacterized protein (TIGR02172 family)
MINIKELKKIATGGQAEIFDLQNDKVLRLMLRPEDNLLIDYEYQSLQIVKQEGLHVPEVFEIVNVDNRPGIIMEKISGHTLTYLFQKKPYLLFNKTKELSKIHSKLNKIKAPGGLVDLRSRIRKLVDKSTFINSDYKNFVYDILTQLPDGDKLCHGDFHPGNIIVNKGDPYIIDWCGVTKADPIADVAHTYLVFRNVPKLPSTLITSYKVLKLAGFLASNTYLKTYKKNYVIDMNLFSKWLLVRAAERTYYGMLSEKANLIKFIKRCKIDYTNQDANYRWHKFL